MALWAYSEKSKSTFMQISKRDYFAAAALTGLLARETGASEGTDAYASIAAEAFEYADAMLKLSKTLLDPIEIDPDQLSEEEQGQSGKTEGK
jgi:hypothetical protein